MSIPISWHSTPVRPNETVIVTGTFKPSYAVRILQLSDGVQGDVNARGQRRPVIAAEAAVVQRSASCIKYDGRGYVMIC